MIFEKKVSIKKMDKEYGWFCFDLLSDEEMRHGRLVDTFELICCVGCEASFRFTFYENKIEKMLQSGFFEKINGNTYFWKNDGVENHCRAYINAQEQGYNIAWKCNNCKRDGILRLKEKQR